ncbi:acetyl-CoA sensor PanZ family protein [Pseudomonas sp. CAU 1711]|uniref:acetyl-CoA sensor PanZ family protein n=1 Tax=Pseudomonas sp. CAU 1711 TaxID=3140356 RepID=UPI0032615091
MPVLLEIVSRPSAQDHSDLGKVYADAPDWLLAPYASIDALLADGIGSGRLIAGRLDGRLLGAALLERGEAHWRLSHLCVRKPDRKRGVGRRILDEARRMAREAGKQLHLAAPKDHLESQALAARSGLPLDSL